ncbi:MAG: hypothetical protein FD149_312 [Rhodospirillaceae bacterium]|nr:MAG: hypothetical protein FD149_312 [Rhodospirillaceae bacterium]
MRFIVYSVLVAAIILFTSQNLHVVSVYFVLAFEAPVVVVVGVAFLAGFVTAIAALLLQAMHRRRGEDARRKEVILRHRGA